MAGSLLAGRYEHVRELGRGGSGRVLLVEDRIEGGLRAVKIVSRGDGERLRWERALLGSLAHPSLARVHELLTVDERLGSPWSLDAGAVALVEEHVDGSSAADATAALESDEARVRFAVTVGAAVARALGAIHGRGLVHCDVKPANIVVPDDDPAAARLIDLGLCRPAGSSDTVSGTFGYLAPEALLGERTTATDLFALGATLHALVLGRTAFDTEASRPTFADAVARRPRVEELPASIPLALRRLVGDLLAESPDERPDAAREVALRLAAIGDELGFEVGSDASLSAGPLPIERAARASVMGLAGRVNELAQLVALLERGVVVAVQGPSGAGRSRLVREAVRVIQAERSSTRRAPTYLTHSSGAPPRLDHDAIVHLEGPRVDWAACRFAVEAADVSGVALSVVAEVSDGFDVPDDVARVVLAPIDTVTLRGLLAELLEVDPADALVDAARGASGGLPGRLCRLVAAGYEAGLDPCRPATLADLARRHPDAAVIPPAARPLVEALTVVGGTLGPGEADLLVDDAPTMAHALIAAGLASVQASGRVALREDVRLEVEPDRAREIARRLAPLDLDSLTRAHVLVALGKSGEAERAFLSAMEQARAAGDPEGAAAVGLRALGRLEDPSLALRLAIADALRARAREEAALDILEGHEGPGAASTRAELARLTGDHERATREAASAGGDARARVVLGRIALAGGDVDAALAAIDGLEGDVEELARAHEIRAFAALLGGRHDEATLHAREATVAARRSGSRAAEARASSVEGSVLQARGLVRDAAACFERAFELADAAGERYAAASYLVNVALGRLERGAAGPAIEALREGARRLTELGRRRDATRALYNLGNAGALVGDDDLARGAVMRARAWADECGDAVASALSAVVESDLAVRAGKIDLASRILEEAWRNVPDACRVTVGARRAVVEAVRGATDAAAAALAAIDELGADHVGVVERSVARARVAMAREAFAEAAVHGAEALTAAEGAGWECRLRAALCASEALERAGRGEEAAGTLARGRELLDYAASTLSPPSRARLRAVPAYQRALAASPQAPSRDDSDARWKVLARHAKRLVREPRVNRLHEAIVDAAVELADAERGFLVQRAPDGTVRTLAARAFGADLDQEHPSTSVATRVLDGGRTVVTVDALEDDRWDAASSVHRMALRSVLAIPLPSSGGRTTALVLDDRLRPGAFDAAVVSIVSDLTELASGAIDRAEALRSERREGRRLAREKRRLSERVESAEQELSELRRRGAKGPAFAGIVAQSEAMRRALHLVERVAASDVPVLVRGESGTGKELVARAVHDASGRREGPYVSENCSAIPDPLLESTLFGHVRGAFTGAERARRGLFEIADGGTLFLDEIGEMSESMQAKLLRVLQDGELRPIGSERTRRVDVRLVAATHRDLLALVESGQFRQDLYYRIAVVQVELPSLRERPDDVPALVAAFLERHASERSARVDANVMAALRAHRWPGNVRELENEIRRALVLADDVISMEHLSPSVRGGEVETLDELDLKGRMASLERRLICRALDETDGNQTRAAGLLGVSRYGLQKMMKRLGVVRG